MYRLSLTKTPKPEPVRQSTALPTSVKDLQQAVHWERYRNWELSKKLKGQISAILLLAAAGCAAGFMWGASVVKGVEIPPVSLRASCEVQVARLIARGSVLESRMDDTITACIEYYDGDPSLPSG